MTVSFADLNAFGFVPSHKIVLETDGSLRFVAVSDAAKSVALAVYLWLVHAAGAETADVLYVGKAGKGVARRSRLLLLTRIGGGAFGNDEAWINAAMLRALRIAAGQRLELLMVSYGPPSAAIREVEAEWRALG